MTNRDEWAVAVVVAAYSTLLGEVAGLIWRALAPRVDVIAAAEGSAEAMKSLLGDDLWLGLIGIGAGVISVLLLVVAAPAAARGPGALVGLAVGGVLGMFVAAHVGHQIGHQQMVDALSARRPQVTPRAIAVILSYFDFTVRAKAVLFTWPFVAVALNGVIDIVDRLRHAGPPPRRAASLYPGSP